MLAWKSHSVTFTTLISHRPAQIFYGKSGESEEHAEWCHWEWQNKDRSWLQLTSNYPSFQKMLSGHAPRHVQEPSLIPAHVSVCSLEGTSPVLWGVLESQQGPALGGLLPGNKDNGCRNASRWVTYARPLPTLSKGACWWGETQDPQSRRSSPRRADTSPAGEPVAKHGLMGGTSAQVSRP